MVDVKVNWRCNVTHTWAAEVPASEAYPLYAKLHYSHDTILALGCTPPPGASGPDLGSAPVKGDNPRERVANNMDVGIQQLDCSIAPNHVPREYNTWADELTHPDFEGFSLDCRLPAPETLFVIFLLPQDFCPLRDFPRCPPKIP